jgi:hypothetical protein
MVDRIEDAGHQRVPIEDGLYRSSLAVPFPRRVFYLSRNHYPCKKNMPEPSTADTSKTGTVEAMVPVILLEKQLGRIKSSLEADVSLGSLKNIDSLMRNIPSEEKTFKAIFDAYSDPVSYKQKFVEQNAFLVYYSKGFDGPDRPNIESDLPVKQTLQLGARNDAFVSWDDFLAELNFARSNPTSSTKESY